MSNEIFLEILDYLDGCDIYKTFLNLNYRFQHLITSPSFPLKVKLRSENKSKLIESCKNVIIPNRHRIISLTLANAKVIDYFFKSCIIIDSSFVNLQSIVLKNVDVDSCMAPLIYLKSLPRLFSLILNIDADEDCELDRIYRIIFSFSSLKYSKVSILSHFDSNILLVLVPLAIHEKLSTIQYLTIDHCCNLEELLSILDHTPQLRRLTCKNLLGMRSDATNPSRTMLFNLTHIYIDIIKLCFTDYEMFFKKILAPVQVLRIKEHKSKDYSEADDWEKLITRYIPYLRSFNYEYHEYDPFDNDNISFFMEINQFTSPFWIQHQWFFQFTIHMNDKHVSGSIQPYRYIYYRLFDYGFEIYV